MTRLDNNKLIYFVDSGTNRPDYGLINKRLIERFVAAGYEVYVVVGPSMDENEYGVLRGVCGSVSIDRVGIKSCETLALLRAVVSLVGFACKNIQVLLTGPYRLYHLLVWYIKSHVLLCKIKPGFTIGKNYNSCRAFAFAAKFLKVSAVSIQHGDYYHAGRTHDKLHEWPSNIVLLWNASSLDYCKRHFNGNNTYSIVGPLFYIKYFGNKSVVKNNKIVVFESEIHKGFDKLCDFIVLHLGVENLLFKPHPYKTMKNKSFVRERFPANIYSRELWEEIPYIGISFMSSAGQELIMLGSPCMFIKTSSALGDVPCQGAYGSESLEEMCLEVKKLYKDPEYYEQYRKAQFSQMMLPDMSWLDVAGNVVAFCDKLARPSGRQATVRTPYDP